MRKVMLVTGRGKTTLLPLDVPADKMALLQQAVTSLGMGRKTPLPLETFVLNAAIRVATEITAGDQSSGV